jgi:hypothetical protein
MWALSTATPFAPKAPKMKLWSTPMPSRLTRATVAKGVTQ